jgi:Mrp family chromosome partitioning ATPase
LRNVQAASQECFGGKGLRSIAVTSTFVGEGRSTVAANFALWLAASGRSVLLIDGDASDPGLSRRFSDGQRPGLIDYLQKDEAQLSTYLMTEERTGLRFLPIGGQGVRNGGLIWTKRLERLMAETVAYDYVIFDVPTLSDLGDIRASARYLDAFVLVIGWNKVSSDSIHVGMDLASSVSERLPGTVLNNVKAKSVRWMLSPQTAFVRRKTI